MKAVARASTEEFAVFNAKIEQQQQHTFASSWIELSQHAVFLFASPKKRQTFCSWSFGEMAILQVDKTRLREGSR